MKTIDNDFDQALTALLDEVADTIQPRPDFEAVLHPTPRVEVAALPGRRSIGATIGIAAAIAALLGGSAFAFERALDDSDDSLATSDTMPRAEVVTTPAPVPATTIAAAPKGLDRPQQVDRVPGDQPATTDKPSEQPKPPVVVTHTAVLGEGSMTATPPRQSFHGTAAPGEKVLVTTDFGTAKTTADHLGEWRIKVTFEGLPGGTTFVARVTFAASPEVFEFQLVRPPDPTTTLAPETTVKPPVVEEPKDEPKPEPTQPAAVEFTANLGEASLKTSPMKQWLWGTATPGSAIRAETPYGSGEAVANSKGKWELGLKMYEVPVGTTVGIRVTNSASAAVFEFSVVRQEPDPVVVDFSANAAFATCDSTPPFNEYWGKSMPGSTVTISSPYGSAQATANGDGKWSARIEYPGAPIGETFTVTVTSTASGNAFQFPFTVVAPG